MIIKLKLILFKVLPHFGNTFFNTQGKFVVNTYTKDEDLIKKAMENWYREKTLAKVKERVSYYSSYFNNEVTTVKVKEQKKRWASCTSKNELLFNWRCAIWSIRIILRISGTGFML